MTKAHQALERFVKSPPEAADRLRVETKTLGAPPQKILEYSAAEAHAEQNLFQSVLSACQSWAEGAARECLFVGQWLGADEETYLTLQWRLAPEDLDKSRPWDGSPEGLIQNQQQQLYMQSRLFLELLKMSFENAQVQLSSLLERNMFLEGQRTDNEKLREQLVRMDADAQADVQDDARFNKLLVLAEKVFQLQAQNKPRG